MTTRDLHNNLPSLLQCLPAVLCGASGDGCWGPVCSVAADGCCTNGDTAVLTEGTTCVQ